MTTVDHIDRTAPGSAAPSPAHVRTASLRPLSLLPSGGSGRVASAAMTLVAVLAGAAPILSIPASILGVSSLANSAMFVVVPLGLAALMLMLTETNAARWTRTGMAAGLLAVTAYDAVRIPLVITGIWPDFIPALGGWVRGSNDTRDVFVGYLWRYLGDGGGMGVVFFMVIGLGLAIRPNWITGRPVVLGVGFGVFVWTGLVGTLMLPGGQETLFRLSVTSFVLSLLGHLIYGGVLGLALRIAVHGMQARQEIGHPARPSAPAGQQPVIDRAA